MKYRSMKDGGGHCHARAYVLSVLVGLAGVASAANVFAQSETLVPSVSEHTDAAAGAAASGKSKVSPDQASNKLEEVVVTANRQQAAQNIQKVPIAVTALDANTLEMLGLTSLSDYAKLAPSVDVQEEGPGVNNINIRGLVTRGLSVSEVEDRSLVAVYIDDTPITLKSANPDLHVLDLERVEVLRGPQGTLYGAGSMAGTIRQITVKPDLENFSGSVESTVSFTDDKGGTNGSGRATLNIPLVKDEAALRINVYKGHDSGYIDNVGTAEKGANDNDVNQFRAALRVVPNDKLTIDASVIYADQKGGLNDAWKITSATSPGKTSALQNLGEYTFGSINPEQTKDKLVISNLSLDYDLGFAHLISSTSGVYRKNTYLQSADYTVNDFVFHGVAPVNAADYTIKNNLHDFVEELRLVSATSGPFKWTTGLFYERGTRHFWEDEPVAGFDARVADVYGFPEYNSQTSSLAFNPNDLFSGTQNTTDRQLAVFAEATYTFADKLDATLGLRYFDWSQNYNVKFTGMFGLLDGPPFDHNAATAETSASTSKANGVNPRAVLAYHLDDDLMVFSEVAKGFRYGGNNQPVPNYCGVSASSTFGPDSLWSYSVGEKGNFLDNRLQLNATAYYVRWNNTQTFDVIPGCGYYFTVNLGKVESKGLEIEAKTKLTPHLQIGFNASYTDAKTAQENTYLGAASGTRVPYSPHSIANLSASYDLPFWEGSLNFSGNWSFRGGAPNLFDASNAAYRYIKASNSLSAAISYQVNGWEYSVFGTNLTNGTKIVDYDRYPYLVNSLEPGDRVYYARPRTLGVRARYDF